MANNLQIYYNKQLMEKDKRFMNVRRGAAGLIISASLISGGYFFHAKSEVEQGINNANPKIAEELQKKKTIYEALTGLSIASAAGAGSIGLNLRKKNKA